MQGRGADPFRELVASLIEESQRVPPMPKPPSALHLIDLGGEAEPAPGAATDEPEAQEEEAAPVAAEPAPAAEPVLPEPAPEPEQEPEPEPEPQQPEPEAQEEEVLPEPSAAPEEEPIQQVLPLPPAAERSPSPQPAAAPSSEGGWSSDRSSPGSSVASAGRRSRVPACAEPQKRKWRGSSGIKPAPGDAIKRLARVGGRAGVRAGRAAAVAG